jgi:hypothetical protein
MKLSVLLLTLFATVQGCADIWQQCGGIGFAGETCCTPGNTCTYSSPWYSQCLKTPSLTPTPSPISSKVYCPSSSDLVVTYGQSSLFNRGWTTKGGAGVATKTTFDLTGGYVEFTMDVSKTVTSINTNLYIIFPKLKDSSGFTISDYCDGARTDSTWCPEFDFVEANGKCCIATTLHTILGPGTGCTAWGCSSKQELGSTNVFKVKISFNNNTLPTMLVNGKVTTLSPKPLASDWSTMTKWMKTNGALIYSSQWKGWVPGCSSSCSSEGSLEESQYSITNLKIQGKIVQGPIPQAC